MKYQLIGLTLLFTICSAFSEVNAQALPQHLISQADSLYKEGQFKEAKKLYKQALKQDPTLIQALRGLSAVAFQKPDWGDVKKWNKKILKLRPEDLEAHYNLGIAYRETGKFKALLLKKKDFSTSQKHFEKVLMQDSTFKDVLLQRGYLERWRRHWKKAIQWAYRQLNLKPQTVSSHTGLFKLYRLFLHNAGSNEVITWLKNKNDSWAALFLAMHYRLNEQYAKADSIALSLLNQKNLSLSRIPVLLELARIYAVQEQDSLAGIYFQKALNSIQSPIDVEFMFEDCKYIFKDSELETYQHLTSVEDKKEFFVKFWTARNPIPAAEINIRAVEHFRRMAYAEKNYWFDGARSWVNNPDKVQELRFPKTFYLNKEFNDKGLIYIRHGEPDDIARTGGADVPTNESWHYYARNDRPEYIFHFLISQFAGGSNWRLVPYITNRAIIADRLGWDTQLDRLYFADSQVEFSSLLATIANESREKVMQAMSTDFHTWDKEVQPMDMPYQLVNFQGADNKTLTEIYVGLSVKDIQAEKKNGLTYRLEHGAAVFDQNWDANGRYYQKEIVNIQNPSQIHHGFWLYRYAFSLEPGEHHITFYSEIPEQNKIGGENFLAEIPDFSRNNLQISDLILAYEVHPTVTDSVLAHHGFQIIPNPSKTFSRKEPVYVYYEIYNLTLDENGRTSFDIENEIKQLKKKKKILGLFGGGKRQSVAIKVSRTGKDASVQEFVIFDVKKMDPGKHLLTVKVKDKNTGQVIDKSVELILKK